MIREGAGDIENQDFKLRNRGTQRFISFEQENGAGTHWEGLNIFSYAKTMAIICI